MRKIPFKKEREPGVVAKWSKMGKSITFIYVDGSPTIVVKSRRGKRLATIGPPYMEADAKTLKYLAKHWPQIRADIDKLYDEQKKNQ